MQVYSADSTAQNRIFFLSDGNPNEQLGRSLPALELSDPIRAALEQLYQQFRTQYQRYFDRRRDG